MADEGIQKMVSDFTFESAAASFNNVDRDDVSRVYDHLKSNMGDNDSAKRYTLLIIEKGLSQKDFNKDMNNPNVFISNFFNGGLHSLTALAAYEGVINNQDILEEKIPQMDDSRFQRSMSRSYQNILDCRVMGLKGELFQKFSHIPFYFHYEDARNNVH